MTDKQWEALKKMTSSSMFKGTTWWACDLDIGRVKVNRVGGDPELLRDSEYYYELEYPNHSVNLFKDTPIDNYDAHYLRTLYDEWSSYIKRRDI